MPKNQSASINGLVEYNQCDWGDLIYASKEYLQAIGLGAGLAFPGEPGGPKRRLRTRDPRGHSVEIKECSHMGAPYTASITFLNWPQRPHKDHQQFEAYPGVMCSRSISWFDEYIGPEDALVAAGLVRADQLPGKPGMRKVRVTILPDGSPLGGPPTCGHQPPAARAPGARWIERAGRSRYRVCVRVSEDEAARRRVALDLAEDKWRSAVLSMNRPAKLVPGSQLSPAVTTTQPAQQYRPLFGDTPTAPGEKEEYRKNVFDSLKELVDFTQTSAY